MKNYLFVLFCLLIYSSFSFSNTKENQNDNGRKRCATHWQGETMEFCDKSGKADITYIFNKKHPTRFGKGDTKIIVTTYSDKGQKIDRKTVGVRNPGIRSSVSLVPTLAIGGNMEKGRVLVRDTVVIKIEKDSLHILPTMQIWHIAPNGILYKTKKEPGQQYTVAADSSCVVMKKEKTGSVFLNIAYHRLTEDKEGIKQQADFFNVFPDRWNKLVKTYRYNSESSGDMEVFTEKNRHLHAFRYWISQKRLYEEHTVTPMQRHVSDSVYCMKLINIMSDAENINDNIDLWMQIRIIIEDRFNDYRDVGDGFLRLLSKQKVKKQKHFWINFFNKELNWLHIDNNEIPTGIRLHYKHKYPKMVKIMQMACTQE